MNVKIRQQQGAFDKRVSLDEPLPTVLATQASQFVIEHDDPVE